MGGLSGGSEGHASSFPDRLDFIASPSLQISFKLFPHSTRSHLTPYQFKLHRNCPTESLIEQTRIEMESLKDHEGYLAKLQQIQDADAARLEALRQADQDRRALFEEVLTRYKDLIKAHEDLKSDMNDLKLANRSLNYNIKGMSAELDTLKLQEVWLHVFYKQWSLYRCRDIV